MRGALDRVFLTPHIWLINRLLQLKGAKTRLGRDAIHLPSNASEFDSGATYQAGVLMLPLVNMLFAWCAFVGLEYIPYRTAPVAILAILLFTCLFVLPSLIMSLFYRPRAVQDEVVYRGD